MGLDQEQPEDFLTLRREVTGRPREFLPVEQGAAELSGQEEVPGLDHPPEAADSSVCTQGR